MARKKNRDVTKDTRFWLYAECHDLVFDNVQRICERTAAQRQSFHFAAMMFDDADILGVTDTLGNVEYQPSTLAFNVVRQTVETLASKIAKKQPLPMPVTSGGNWFAKRRAKKLGKLFQGQLENSGVWKTSPAVARDTGLYGIGISHNYRVGKSIHHDRILPWELCVDPREAMYGAPRTMYLRRWVDKYVLAERFPEFREEILDAESSEYKEDGFDVGYDDTCDLVLVVEAYRLPSRVLEKGDPDYDDDSPQEITRDHDQPDVRRDVDKTSSEPGPKRPAHDGTHTICIPGATLLKEPYRRQYFPFTILRMNEPLMGFYGAGFARQLSGLQYCINDTSSVTQEAHALSGGYILVEAGSNIDTEKMDNGRGTIIKYQGPQPTWINPQPVHPSTWQFVLDLIPKAYEMTGVSQLSAQSQKPAGIESALALNTFNDIETERFALFAKQYANYHIDIAWQQFDLLEEIADEYGGATVRLSSKDRGQRKLLNIDFDAVRLDRDEFTLDVFDVDLLSKKPAARLQEIDIFINAGWLSREDAMMLIDMPDLERAGNLVLSSTRIIEEIIDRILDAEDPDEPGVYTYPEPVFNLKMCISKGIQMYLDAKLDGAPDENLQLVMQFITDAKELLASATASVTEPPPPVDPMAMGAPPMDPAMMAPPGMPTGMPPDMPPGPGGMAPPTPDMAMAPPPTLG